MFALSKIIGFLIDPATLLLFLMAIALLMGFCPRNWVRQSGCRFLKAICLCFLLATFVPIGGWGVAFLEDKFADVPLPDKVDGIVLLTGDEAPFMAEVRDRASVLTSMARYVYLGELAQRYPDAKIVIAGDTRPLFSAKNLTTQDVSKRVLQAMKIEDRRVVFEDKSRNTYENAVFSFEKAKPGKEEKWLLVTSAFHMPRSVLCFEKAGWSVIPAQSDYMTSGLSFIGVSKNVAHNLRYLSTAAHEYYGLVAYWILGWTERLWP